MAIMGIVVFVSVFWVFDGGLTESLTNISNQLAERHSNLTAIINPDSLVFYSIPSVFCGCDIQFTFSSQPQLFNIVLLLINLKDLGVIIITYVIAAISFLFVIFGGIYASVT